MGTPVRLGQFTQDADKFREVTEKAEAAREFETNHKCLTCIHERVCNVAGAVRAMNAEGDLVISSCGAYQLDASPILEGLTAEDIEEDEDDLYPEGESK